MAFEYFYGKEVLVKYYNFGIMIIVFHRTIFVKSQFATSRRGDIDGAEK